MKIQVFSVIYYSVLARSQVDLVVTTMIVVMYTVLKLLIVEAPLKLVIAGRIRSNLQDPIFRVWSPELERTAGSTTHPCVRVCHTVCEMHKLSCTSQEQRTDRRTSVEFCTEQST